MMSERTAIFGEVLGRKVSVVSTIDHPFPSPPIHLVDGHRKLYRDFGRDVLVLNWDVSQPDAIRYRYDLTTDTGLLSKNPYIYHYTPGIGYHEQRFDPAPLPLVSQCIPVAVAEIKRRRPQVRVSEDDLMSRCAVIIDATRTASATSTVPSDVTQNLLVTFYRLFGQPDLAAFVREQYDAYSRCLLLAKWIPWCLRNVRDVMAFEDLASAGVFQRAPFRWRDSTVPLPVERWSAQEAADLIEAERVLASLDVFLWSLAVAGIRHFGNDREMFARLAAAAGDNSIAALQLTAKGQDCARFLKLEEDIGILVDVENDTVRVSSRKNHPTKRTRIATFGSFFVAIGDELGGLLSNYRDGGYAERVVGYA